MEINPSEVTKILKEQIKNFGDKAEVTEVGQVLSVGDGIATVSYTHLRAHETPEHLVCRLLLEKKNHYPE